jgi:hypothetical protein
MIIMTKALLVSLAKVILVLVCNNFISNFFFKLYQSTKEISTQQVVNLANEKNYYCAATNLLFSILLFFVLRRVTDIGKVAIFILCLLSLVLNILISRVHII